MTEEERRPVPVEVGRVIDPAGRPAVLLQMPDGYLVMAPHDARELAAALAATALRIEAEVN